MPIIIPTPGIFRMAPVPGRLIPEMQINDVINICIVFLTRRSEKVKNKYYYLPGMVIFVPGMVTVKEIKICERTINQTLEE